MAMNPVRMAKSMMNVELPVQQLASIWMKIFPAMRSVLRGVSVQRGKWNLERNVFILRTVQVSYEFNVVLLLLNFNHSESVISHSVAIVNSLTGLLMVIDEDGSCPPGKIYDSCGTACPLTCFNLDEEIQCTEECVQGCFCPERKVEFGRKCVFPFQCPSKSEAIIFYFIFCYVYYR